MDLGPRSQYIQELVFSDAYDGFVVDKLSNTSYKDVSEMLNLLIVSRYANKTYVDKFDVGRGVNVMSFFDKRNRNFVDGDYSQMLSISSEFGVVEFEQGNYPEIPNRQDPIFINNPLSDDPVFGIYFSSETQTRDFITPKRTIINPILSISTQCAFNYYDNFSQYVPLYQWQINTNNSSDSIFGSRSNDWYTNRMSLSGITPNQDPNNPINTFFYHRYQSLDRLNSLSRYFRTKPSNFSKDYKGYIYSVDYDQIGPFPPSNPSSGWYDFEYETQWITPNPPNQDLTRVFTVGTPYHFYFGLKKGKTAWDRFAKKWLDLETFTD
jgi:hypothetical protein